METSPVEQTASTWPGLAEARALAARHGSHRIGTQHLLMVLLAGPDDGARRVLRASGVDQEAVDVALGAILGSGGPTRRQLSTDEVETSERVAAVLVDADARRGARTTAGDDHVLAALMNGDDMSIARMIVSSIGARQQVLSGLKAAQTRR